MVLPTWALWVALASMVVGLLGVLLPAIPGVAFMWVAILVYAIAERFATIDPLSFGILTVLGLAGTTADLWMSQLGAKVSGASFSSVLASLAGATLGALVGLLLAGVGAIPGAIVGAVLGVFLNEYRVRKELEAAWKATIGLLIGFTLSSLVQLFIGVLMLVIFVWQVLRG